MQEATKTSLSRAGHTGPIHQADDGRAVAVDVQHLVKTFGKHAAVKDVSFTIGKGEIFGLLGPNGAGKSTTINMMCGYLKPTSGDVTINGLSLAEHVRKVKRIIGVVPQEIALYKDVTLLSPKGRQASQHHPGGSLPPKRPRLQRVGEARTY